MFQKAEVCIKIGGIVGKGVDVDLKRLKQIGIERPVSGSKPGAIRLKFDPQCDHIIDRTGRPTKGLVLSGIAFRRQGRRVQRLSREALCKPQDNEAEKKTAPNDVSHTGLD
jgi:hypothetical protein